MGITDFHKFIRAKHSKSIYYLPFEKVKNTTVAIDTPCLMYKYVIANQIDNLNWINNFLFLIFTLKSENIEPVFIFEGKLQHSEKLKTQKKRKDIKESNAKKVLLLKYLVEQYLESNIISEELAIEWNKFFPDKEFDHKLMSWSIDRKDRYSKSIGESYYIFLKEILDLLNIQHVEENYEAETLCCFLQKLGKVDFVLSTDSDSLVYEGDSRLIIKSIDFKKKCFEIIDKKNLLESLKLTQESFVDFCILTGTDYNTTIPLIGICTAYNLILKYKTIEFALEHIKQHMLKKCKEKNNYLQSLKNTNIFNEEDDVLQICETIQKDDTVMKSLLNVEWIRKNYNFQVGDFNYIRDVNFQKSSFNKEHLFKLTEFFKNSGVCLFSYVEKLMLRCQS